MIYTYTIAKKAYLFPVVLAIFSACQVQQYQQNVVDSSLHYRDVMEESLADTSIARMSYGDFFKDPELLSLIDNALSKNIDIQVALKQIEYASHAFRQAKWLYAPVVNANLANVGINRPSGNSLNGIMASQFAGQTYLMDYTSAVNVSWEVDVWGKIKGQKQEALVDFLKTQEATNAVKTRLVGEVVQGYYNLLMLDKQLHVTLQNLSLADSTLNIVKKQLSVGVANSLAVQQQETAKDQIRKQVPEIESLIHIQENALRILAGDYPGEIQRKGGLDEVAVPESVATGIPVNLLANRPDVRMSELEVRRSFASIHVARVSMYPGLNITAQGGLNALKASNWFSIPGSLFGMATGVIAQPILNGRQLKTRYEQSKIAAEQAELNFKQSILVASGEVSDALIRIAKLQEQKQINQGMVAQAQQLVKNSLILYRLNEATYLEVIVAQRNKLQAELDLAASKAQKLNAMATLYRSLGGGWM